MKKYNENNDLLFCPLGGSGEIGMNLNLYCSEGKWLMVDLGMTFANDYYPGIDLLYPDPSFIEQRRDKLVGIILTHGHEDHIGAVAQLWPSLRAPIYATPFTMELVKEKLAEQGLLEQADLHVIPMGGTVDLPAFKVSWVPLAHSIAEGNAVKIDTKHGVLFHTGDWKLDDRPLIGEPTPGHELAKLGQQGVLAMVGDSTNVFNPNVSGSEGEVRDNLIGLVAEQKGRVVASTFASNVARLETLGEVAKACGRHVALLGRSMDRISKAAKATGYLEDFPPIIHEDDIDNIPKDKLMIICTGCQGESRAALSRLVNDDFHFASLSPNDTVILSSKIIPGNELTIGRLINQMVDQGLKVITEKDAFVHVSGHPGQPELADMYDWIRPHIAIPVHGEARHLERHKAFALDSGVKHAHAPRNGQIIRLSYEKGAEVVGEAPIGLLALDGSRLVQADGPSINERRRLQHNGIAMISLAMNKRGDLVSDPIVSIHGIPGWHHDDDLFDLILDIIDRVLERATRNQLKQDYALSESIRIKVRKLIRETTRKNAQVIVHLQRIDGE